MGWVMTFNFSEMEYMTGHH